MAWILLTETHGVVTFRAPFPLIADFLYDMALQLGGMV
jgi:hypothetical protein